MTYTCGWATKRSEGTIDIDAATMKDAKKRARAVLRDGYGLRVKITGIERWAPGMARKPE